MIYSRFFIILLLHTFLITNLFSQTGESNSPVSEITENENETGKEENTSSDLLSDLTEDIKFSGSWFIAYQDRRIRNERTNLFTLKRGQLGLTKKFNKHISARITQETSIDQEGDGAGDAEFIMKYAFIQYNFNNFIFFTNSFIEFGVVHRPWVEYEQSINNYRVQGKMFLERESFLASADYGITVFSLLGGEINDEYRKNVNDKFPGKYGSVSFGIYNGGGYDAFKFNKHMFIEGKLSLRLFPELIPGFQVSGIGGYGKGNTAKAPGLSIAAVFVSYENKFITFTSQYYSGEGNKNGTDIDSTGNSIKQHGFSLFGEYKIPEINLSLFARYDKLDANNLTNLYSKTYIAGIAYHFLGDNKILIDFEREDFNDNNLSDDYWVEFAVEFGLN